MLSKRNLTNVIKWPLGLLAFMWVVFIIDYYLFGGLLGAYYGMHPRELAGVPGIVLSPIFHGGWGHLLSNSLPFVSLTGLLVFFYPRLWPRVLASLWLGTGALVWMLGRGDTIHIGASGIVYALAAFLAFSGIFRRDFRAVVVSLVVLFYYGGMIVGILPGQEGISWESHLLGLVMGVIGAYVYRSELEEHEVMAQEKKATRHAPTIKEPFLDADAFAKTKKERDNERFWEKLKVLSERERLER